MSYRSRALLLGALVPSLALVSLAATAYAGESLRLLKVEVINGIFSRPERAWDASALAAAMGSNVGVAFEFAAPSTFEASLEARLWEREERSGRALATSTNRFEGDPGRGGRGAGRGEVFVLGPDYVYPSATLFPDARKVFLELLRAGPTQVYVTSHQTLRPGDTRVPWGVDRAATHAITILPRDANGRVPSQMLVMFLSDGSDPSERGGTRAER